MVLEGDGHLDQPLQELPVLSGELEPQRFEDLVGHEELAPVEQGDELGEARIAFPACDRTSLRANALARQFRPPLPRSQTAGPAPSCREASRAWQGRPFRQAWPD